MSIQSRMIKMVRILKWFFFLFFFLIIKFIRKNDVAQFTSTVIVRVYCSVRKKKKNSEQTNCSGLFLFVFLSFLLQSCIKKRVERGLRKRGNLERRKKLTLKWIKISLSSLRLSFEIFASTFFFLYLSTKFIYGKPEFIFEFYRIN